MNICGIFKHTVSVIFYKNIWCKMICYKIEAARCSLKYLMTIYPSNYLWNWSSSTDYFWPPSANNIFRPKIILDAALRIRQQRIGWKLLPSHRLAVVHDFHYQSWRLIYLVKCVIFDGILTQEEGSSREWWWWSVMYFLDPSQVVTLFFEKHFHAFLVSL